MMGVSGLNFMALMKGEGGGGWLNDNEPFRCLRSRSTSCPNFRQDFLAEIFAKVSCRDLGHGVDRKFSQANKTRQDQGSVLV